MSQRRIVELSLEWQILASVCRMNRKAICTELVDDVVATIDIERFPRNQLRGVMRENVVATPTSSILARLRLEPCLWGN